MDLFEKKKNLESSKPLAFIAKFLELRVSIKKKKNKLVCRIVQKSNYIIAYVRTDVDRKLTNQELKIRQ